ncbi:MAG: hypothetical protein HZB25_11260 [Candidatus Eisenbacteria bacterium]|nr:hypothetical protein [Candidatus Eisenbacteria bacterium]
MSPGEGAALASAAREAAVRLHAFMEARFWDGATLGGPDQGVRWHLRIGRFVKSYLPLLQRRERFVFRQGQGYWAMANRELARATGEARYGAIARAVADECLASQLPDGSWEYPLRARRHLKATVEGNFGAVTLLGAWEDTADPRYRDGALRWHRFLEERIGYEPHPSGGLAVHYFDRPRGLVPNNSAEMVWVLGRYATSLSDPAFLARVPALETFLEAVQEPTGEFPYELPGRHDARHQPHYLCYQYNAFQALKLWWHHEAHGDARAGGLARRATAYLRGGVRRGGASRCDCFHDLPEVLYYADVLALALQSGARHGVEGAAELSDRGLRWTLSRQLPSGGFRFSRGDYGLLSDRRFYPRNLAMTLFHLLEWARREGGRE